MICSSIVSNVNSADRFAGQITRSVPIVRAEGTIIPSRPRVAVAPPILRHRRRLSAGRSAREPHRSAPLEYGRPAATLPTSDSAKTTRVAPHRVQRTRRAHRSPEQCRTRPGPLQSTQEPNDPPPPIVVRASRPQEPMIFGCLNATNAGETPAWRPPTRIQMLKVPPNVNSLSKVHLGTML